MRRWIIGALAVAVLGFTVWRGPIGFAADATPVADEDHPLVGTWVVTDPHAYTQGSEFLITFFADSNALVTDGRGRTWQGVWEPLSDHAGRWTVVLLGVPVTGDPGATFVANAFVDQSGDHFVNTDSTYYPDEKKLHGERVKSAFDETGSAASRATAAP